MLLSFKCSTSWCPHQLNFTVLIHSLRSHSVVFCHGRQLPSTEQQTDTISDYLVNTVEHLATKEPDISLRSWWRPKTELKGEKILNLHSSSGPKLNSKWRLMLLRTCWMCKYAPVFLPYELLQGHCISVVFVFLAKESVIRGLISSFSVFCASWCSKAAVSKAFGSQHNVSMRQTNISCQL